MPLVLLESDLQSLRTHQAQAGRRAGIAIGQWRRQETLKGQALPPQAPSVWNWQRSISRPSQVRSNEKQRDERTGLELDFQTEEVDSRDIPDADKSGPESSRRNVGEGEGEF